MPESKQNLQEPVIQSNSGANLSPDFIEMAVHDLLAPLRKLGVLTDRLTNKYKNLVDKDGEVEQYSSRIRDCIDDLRNLVESLKEYGYSTLEQMHPVPCETEQIIRRSLYESQAGFANNRANITISSELPVIETDRAQCRLLFKCIFDNSFVFSKKDTPLKINVNSKQLGEDEKKHFNLQDHKLYYKIEIADNGIGFDRENTKVIFRPFVRLNGKTYSGNGLGLAIVKQITDNHQGIVYAESEENAGARFFLILPEKQ
jgi:signal transduction histidine kinase